jgi:signal transduction histidine kinase
VQDVQGSPGLSYQQNNCVIDYVGISLRDENGVRYRFRLQGIDTAWGELTSRRSVTYASLPPGSYRFEVQAINADGISSTRPAVLSFSILPPFWQRWWFLVGAALALLLAFGSIVRYISTQRLLRRVQVLEREHAVQIERERTRDRIARDLHDDVASTLGSVVIYSESLKRRIQKDSESSDLTERISALSLEAQEALGDIVWSTSPTHDTLKELLTRIRDIASETCSARGIRYDISLPAEIPDITLAEEIRKSIFLIFKEAMNNVLKHAKAARVQITASLSGGRLRLVIIDDGMGIGGEAGNGSHRGHGLRNMAHRAKEIGAQFAVRSEPGKGTTIDMSYKMT